MSGREVLFWHERAVGFETKRKRIIEQRSKD